jgi:hypothetical protein
VYPPGSYPLAGPNGPYGANPNHLSQRPGTETHDGFYLRMQLGVSSNTFTGRSGGRTVQFSGTGGSFDIALGYSLTSHLVVYGELLFAGAADGEGQILVNGVGQGQASVDNNLYGIGPGAAYYLSWNFFLTTSFLLASCNEMEGGGNVTVNGKAGFAFEALVGKEWWVSDNWGLGVSGQMILGTMHGQDTDLVLNAVPNWQTRQFGLLFSSTYN